MTSPTVSTDHGTYDVLPACEVDGPAADCAPDMATHAVFHESGALAGFASDAGVAWDASGTPWPRPFASLADAAAGVAGTDRDAVRAAEPWCNHDAPAVRNGVCECGEAVHYHGTGDGTGPCTCPSPLTYAPQWTAAACTSEACTECGAKAGSACEPWCIADQVPAS
jgi:hypothetical protein